MGRHLGLIVVHVNRVLRRLRESGIAALQGHVTIIQDLDRLRKTACVREEEPDLCIDAPMDPIDLRGVAPGGDGAFDAAVEATA